MAMVRLGVLAAEYAQWLLVSRAVLAMMMALTCFLCFVLRSRLLILLSLNPFSGHSSCCIVLATLGGNDRENLQRAIKKH